MSSQHRFSFYYFLQLSWTASSKFLPAVESGHVTKNFPFSIFDLFYIIQNHRSRIYVSYVIGQTITSQCDLSQQDLSDLTLVLLCYLVVVAGVGVDLVDCDFIGLYSPSMWICDTQRFLQLTCRELGHYLSGLILQLLPKSIIQRSHYLSIWILVKCNSIKVGMQVHSFALKSGNFDEIASQITSFEGEIEHVSIVQRLMDVSQQVQQVSGHEGSLERQAVFVEFQYFVAPIDGVDGVDILLVLGHASEAVVRVIGDVGKMIVIEHFDPVALDIIGPDCSLSEGLGFSICKSVKCLYKSIEFVSSVEIISISKVIPGNL